LFIGYPIISTPEGPHRIDALLVSPNRGLVVFDLVEGTELGNYQERQDDSANKLEARLKTHRRLMRRRNLKIPIHTLSFAPGIQITANPEDEYCVADRHALVPALQRLEWDNPDLPVYRAALSAVESISALRKSRTPRTVTRPDSRAGKLKAMEDSIATLDTMQGRAVIETVTGVQRIRGLAGSGKTVVLALKAAYLHAQHPEWRIAVTFHTRSLKGHFRRLINNFSLEQTGNEPDWDSLRIVNAWGAPGGRERDGLYYEFCRTNDLEYLDFRSARHSFTRGREFSGVCERALLQFHQSSRRQPVYDAILVDEAQDLPDTFFQLCYELLNDEHRLVYAYDELQSLSGESVSSPETMFGSHVDGSPRVSFGVATGSDDSRDLILEKCYRNSRPVLVTAHALGFGIYRQPRKRLRGPLELSSSPALKGTNESGLVQMFDHPHLWEEIGYRSREGELREGMLVTLFRPHDTSPRFLEDHSDLEDLVEFVCFSNAEKQAEWTALEIKKNLEDDGLRHDDIVIVNPDPLTTRSKVGPIRRRLLDFGINSHLAGVDTSSDVFFQPHTDSVTFTGIHRAKGNEAAMVYVVNAQDCHTAARNLASIRNQLFVAITRSKAWVRVLGVGKGMQALQGEFSRLHACEFELRFTYPTAEQREKLRIVHRDMSAGDLRRLKKQRKDLDQLVRDFEAGRLHLDDLSEEVVDKLRSLLMGP
jgi:superfamily I DNA and RNA helicase